jgi:conjugative transfer signal peptidase TraF
MRGAGVFAAFTDADLTAVESRIDSRLRFGGVAAGAPSRSSTAERQSAWLRRRGGRRMNRAYMKATVAAAGLLGGLFLFLAWHPPAPRCLWNASESAPVGLYRIEPTAHVRRGDLVAIRPPAAVGAFLDKRHYLPSGLPLLKRVAALPGARVCRSGVFVTVDGVGVARALPRDRAGRPLPIWHGCRIVGAGEIFLINAAPLSLDSRYFGPLPTAGLVGIAHPVVTRDSGGGALRWHVPASKAFQFPTSKE